MFRKVEFFPTRRHTSTLGFRLQQSRGAHSPDPDFETEFRNWPTLKNSRVQTPPTSKLTRVHGDTQMAHSLLLRHNFFASVTTKPGRQQMRAWNRNTHDRYGVFDKKLMAGYVLWERYWVAPRFVACVWTRMFHPQWGRDIATLHYFSWQCSFPGKQVLWTHGTLK